MYIYIYNIYIYIIYIYIFIIYYIYIYIYTYTHKSPFSLLFVLTPDERPPLLRGHFCSAEGVPSQKG